MQIMEYADEYAMPGAGMTVYYSLQELLRTMRQISKFLKGEHIEFVYRAFSSKYY